MMTIGRRCTSLKRQRKVGFPFAGASGLCRTLLFVVCWLFAAYAAAAEPNFQIETLSGKSVRGPLRSIGPRWVVGIGEASVTDLVSLRRIGAPPPEFPSREQVIFANGDRLPGNILKLEGERLHFRFRGEETALPLSALSVLWLAPPEGGEEPERLRQRLTHESRPRDVLYLRNGDTIEGVVTGLDDRAVRLEANRKTLTIERTKAAVIALNTELASLLRPKTSYARVVLADGTRLALATAEMAEGKPISATTLFKTSVSFPLADLYALTILNGPAVPLAELKPKKYEHTPFLGDSWPYTLDSSVDRRDLRLAGGTYESGLGLHSESRLTYDFPAGRYRRFEALVGLDDRTGRTGIVRLRVLVDGKPAEIDGPAELTHRSGPIPVRVDLTGAKELTLVVEFGERGSVQDHVNWADARLILK
jgi:hypothetical protein